MWQQRVVMAACLCLLAACRPDAPQATTAPTTTSLTGSVEVTYPQDGTVVYSELLHVSGTAVDIPNQTFLVRLIGAEEQTVTEAAVQVRDDGGWDVALAHGYSGEPMEMTLLALPAEVGVPADVDYAIRQIVVAGQSYRPQGAFGSIVSPPDGGTVGGESFQVAGTVSGAFENSFVLALVDADGEQIDMIPVTATNPFYIDEVPWLAELATNGYTGAAVVEVYVLNAMDGSKILLGSANVTVTQEAG